MTRNKTTFHSKLIPRFILNCSAFSASFLLIQYIIIKIIQLTLKYKPSTCTVIEEMYQTRNYKCLFCSCWIVPLQIIMCPINLPFSEWTNYKCIHQCYNKSLLIIIFNFFTSYTDVFMPFCKHRISCFKHFWLSML